jgi:putative transcriptional regulator
MFRYGLAIGRLGRGLLGGLLLALPAAGPVEARSLTLAGFPAAGLVEGLLLVARPDLPDPRFSRTVILLLRIDLHGAVGIVINRRTNVAVREVLKREAGRDELPLGRDFGTLHYGGPIALQALHVLARGAGAEQVVANVRLVVDDQALQHLLMQPAAKPGELLFYAGFAGWSAGQLEGEIRRGDWFLWPASEEMVFDRPAEGLWEDLLKDAAGVWTEGPLEPSPALASGP